jgi:HPt (histidine-containing phosphotransfer) domain-containing protein
MPGSCNIKLYVDPFAFTDMRRMIAVSVLTEDSQCWIFMTNEMSETEANLEMILADMAQDFIEGCEDRLDEIDACLSRIRDRQGVAENEVLEVKRHVHGLKGLGTTFRFPSISIISHALEDYFEALFELSEEGVYDVQLFIDRIREITETRIDLPHDDTLEMLRNLPLMARRRAVKKDNKEVTLLLHMPPGIQRKIIGKELFQFGFNVTIVETALDAIQEGILREPDIIMSTMVTSSLSGVELAGVFFAVNATRNSPFLLVTAEELDQDVFADLPNNVTILRKGRDFARDLMAFMKEHSFVGQRR